MSPTPVKDRSTPVNVDGSITVVAAALTVILTGIAFWLSYEHLQEVSGRHGLVDGSARSWAWPATVDLFIVIGELLILRASLAKGIDGWAIALATTGSLGSIALNVTGVGADARPLDYVVAAVPPIAALLAFGALMRQVHTYLARRALTPPLTGVDPALTPVNATVERDDIRATEAALPTAPARPELPPSEGAVNHPSTAVDLCPPVIYTNRNDQLIRALYGMSFVRPSTRQMTEAMSDAGLGGSESTARTARGRVETTEPYLADFPTAIAA
ncbi:DUF2637 domain-containing protein [Streptomyces xanthochromogenes]|uniref:DUF2637 domain-containing protein n=1 Tax=Streptomyces xanthochromogenes TaxID=67384 RepID=UPI00382799A6